MPELTLRRWFEYFTEETGETVTHIVFNCSHVFVAEQFAAIQNDELLAWDDIPESVLDQPFDAGFGLPESPDFCAWSASWVIFNDTYDGLEDVVWVPRNPIAHTPSRPGG